MCVQPISVSTDYTDYLVPLLQFMSHLLWKSVLIFKYQENYRERVRQDKSTDHLLPHTSSVCNTGFLCSVRFCMNIQYQHFKYKKPPEKMS